MNLKDITPKDVEEMSYIDLVSFLREENRPPGSKKTVREILQNSFIDRKSKILEVGCTNGFTSLEIARLVGCEVFGIDISENSLENARGRAGDETVTFLKGSSYKIPFEDKFFDLVFCGNATSFMEEKGDAISEYFRVTKDWGFVALTPMYYLDQPNSGVVEKVSEIIGTNIDIRTKGDWFSLFKKEEFEVYYSKDYRFKKKSDEEVEQYIHRFFQKDFLKGLDRETLDKLKNRWEKIMKTFNENLSFVGYSVILLRKRTEIEEVELFDEVNSL